MYTKDGPLYVNIRKSDGAKFQFHFPTRQFMDSKDKEIKSKNIGLSKGLIEFYNNIDPLFLPYIKYDFVGNLYNGYATIELNGKWNLVDTQGKLFSPNQWFDDIGDFYDGYVKIKLNNKWNFIDTQGKLVSPNQWFDGVGRFTYGYATVKLNNKYNFIDTRGKLVSPNQWFDWIDDFYDGYAIVRLNDKWYKIDTKGNIMTAMNEHTVTITKSDIKNMVMECVSKIIKEMNIKATE